MKRVLIIHGWGGSEFPHWQSWLAGKLAQENYTVSFPNLPNKDMPLWEEWKEFLLKEIEWFKPQVVVCHSLGNFMWMKLVDELDIRLEKLLLVAPPHLENEIEELATFYPCQIPKDLKSQKSLLVVSTNDKYLKLEDANIIKDRLNIDMKILENAGHINTDAGFGAWDFALEWIKD
jgi:predicted alpha/beta hydrolase family esterase